MRINFSSNNYCVNSKGYHLGIPAVNGNVTNNLSHFKCDIYSAINPKCPNFQFPKFFASYDDDQKKAYMKKCLESHEIIQAMGSKANDIDVYIQRSTSCSTKNSPEADCYFQTNGEMLNYEVSVPALKIKDALRPCYDMFIDRDAKKITNVPIKVEEHPQEVLQRIIGGNLYDLAVSSPYNQNYLKLDK